MILRVASLVAFVVYLQLLLLSVKISHVCKYYKDFVSTNLWDAVNPAVSQEYDFIVVGAGSAGCVVANRLSKHNRVLVIEAGGTPFYANSVPIMTGLLLDNKEIAYTYKTVPQKHASHGTFDNISFWTRGYSLGGSSNINYMMYVRAHKFDYDNWANLTGDNSWNYTNLLPYFKRSIDYHGNFPSDYHYGSSYGSQHVESHQSFPLYKVFLAAGQELGFETGIDLNAPQRVGFGPVETNQRQGKRETSYTAFIEPILHRESLVISKYSQAVKVDLDKSNRAVGVWYMQHGKRKYAKAKKEVIVSGGSVDSPKLLMLSGIGPTTDLVQLGIKPRIDLPVGENLKDHVMTILMPFTITSNYSLTFRPDRDLGILDLINYYWKGTGAVSFPGSCSFAQAIFSSSESATKHDLELWPNFQLIITNMSPYRNIASEFSKFMKIRYDIVEQLFRNSIQHDKDGFMISLTLGLPKSVGSIKLASKDPTQDPIIDPKYLSHPDDITRFVEAIKFAFKMVEKTKAFQELNATYVDTPIDDCKMHKFKSDKYWECYLRHISLTMYHPVGTCKMGSGPKDNSSVVDSQLRVLHTTGLRVADSSIMPEIVNTNTNSATVMIGEKAADIIREYWAKQYLVCSLSEIIQSAAWSHAKMCFYSKFV